MSDRRVFRVGGVPEHFNAPWHLAMEGGVFDDQPFGVAWQNVPGGTGALCEALRNRTLDIAVLLTEGIVADIANGSDAQIFGVYVASPLCWGVHVHASSSFQTTDDLQGRRFAISRFGSGSHIMTFVEAERRGWDPQEDLRFVRVGTLDGARKAMGDEHADGFLWEKFTTKPVVDRGEWRRVGECWTPWPAFVFAAPPEILQASGLQVKALVDAIRAYCGRVMADPAGSVAFIAERYGLRTEDAAAWFADTRWACSTTVDRDMIQQTAAALERVEAIPAGTGARAAAACLDL